MGKHFWRLKLPPEAFPPAPLCLAGADLVQILIMGPWEGALVTRRGRLGTWGPGGCQHARGVGLKESAQRLLPTAPRLAQGGLAAFGEQAVTNQLVVKSQTGPSLRCLHNEGSAITSASGGKAG